MENNSEIIIYNTEDGLTKVEVSFIDDNVWLTQDQMAVLFQKSKSTINEHIKNIYEDGELQRVSTMKKFGNSEFSKKPTNYYNLDMIISVGYRVRYMKKGFAMDDERLKNLGGGGYFKELLERIRDIRASEKVFYRQVLEIYATSIDYNPTAEESILFFKKVQNKIHFAISGETAAEVIYNRADAEKEFMGLTSFVGDQPTLREAKIAKNYLDEKELHAMGQLVSGYLDFAERQAEKEIPMTMNDWSKHLDKILIATGENLLEGNGTISHIEAMKKAETEYRKYKARTISPVEKDFLDTVSQLTKFTKK